MNPIYPCAAIFGALFFIIGCGLIDIPLLCCSALLFGCGAAGVIRTEEIP